MALELDERRLLPVGVHQATIEEVRDRFGAFQRTTRRSVLFGKFESYVEALRKADFKGSLIVDGSFVMGCVDEPEDIDIVLVLAGDWDMTADLQPYQYNLVSKKDVRRSYPFDVIPVREGSVEEAKWTDFFTKVNVKWY